MDGWTNGWMGVSNSKGFTVTRHSNDLSIHQWVRSAIHDLQQPTSPIGFLSLKLPPPPCAVLLILPRKVRGAKYYIYCVLFTHYTYIYIHNYKCVYIFIDLYIFILYLRGKP